MRPGAKVDFSAIDYGSYDIGLVDDLLISRLFKTTNQQLNIYNNLRIDNIYHSNNMSESLNSY